MRSIRFDSDQWGEIADSLLRNKTRSALTAFGIFWGIFMLLLLIGGGDGFEKVIAKKFDGFATNSGFMFARVTSKPYKGFRKGRWWYIEVEDVERVRRAVPELDVVTPTIGRWGQKALFSNRTCDVSLSGQYPEYSLVQDPKLTYGRLLNEVDIAQRRKVCIIGSRVFEELFTDGKDPCGKSIQVDGMHFTVVGVSGKEESGMHMGGNVTTQIIMPYTTLQQAYNMGPRVQMLALTARPGHTMSELQKRVASVIKRAHSIHPDDPQAVNMINAEAMFSMVEELFGGISILVWMIGVGTLLGGIIGVSNIMVVTVKERTTEIGIRRAIGATPGSITFMVMSESVALTLVAGMSGICMAVLVLGVMENAILAHGEPSPFQISFVTAVVAALTLSALGVVAGLAPAARAMSIKPVDAMREE